MATYLTCRGQCETEAESVALIVAESHGLSAGTYSFAYVAGWAGGDVDKVRAAATTVTKAAHTILAAIDSTNSDPDPTEPDAARPAAEVMAA